MLSHNILVTRPLQQGASLCQRLQKLGFQTVHVPVMEVSALASTKDKNHIHKIFEDLLSFDYFVLVSLNAAEQFFQLLSNEYPKANYLSSNSQFCTVGKTTAAYLQSQGITAQYPQENMDSDGLLALPVMSADIIEGKNILIIRGEGGREKISQVLTERQAIVTSLPLYRRYAPLDNQQALREALKDSNLIVVNSGESLHNLDIIADIKNTSYRQKTVLVPGPRVAEIAQQKGFEKIICADNATDSAVVNAIQKYYA